MSIINKHVLFACCLVVLGIVACQDKNGTISAGESAVVQLNEVITYKDGRTQFDIECVDLLEDSRCPEFTNCIWAGRAVIRIEIDNEEWMDLGLGDLTTGTTEPYSYSGVHKGQTISLLSVEFGMASNQGVADKYRFKIQVD